MSLRLSLTFLSLFSFLSIGAIVVTAQPQDNADPYTWLEDVHGAKPLAWAAEQNKKSLGILKADPRYRKNYDSILEVLDASDRIPSGSIRHGFVYNFWQDAKNPKGIWRRTSIADYANPAPKWDILLDVDALARAKRKIGCSKAPNARPRKHAA